jgi:hypothetical protein
MASAIMTKMQLGSLTFLALKFSALFMSLTMLSQPASCLLHHPKLDDGVPDRGDSASNLVANAYIICLSDTNNNVNITMTQLMNTAVQDGGQIEYVYKNAFNGFSVTGMSDSRITEILDSSLVDSASRVRKSVISTHTSTLMLLMRNSFFHNMFLLSMLITMIN